MMPARTTPRIQPTTVLPAHLRLPVVWLKSIGNHTAAILLADILAAWSARLPAAPKRKPGAGLNADELPLNYKEVSARLVISTRSLSRAMKLLDKVKALRVRQADRQINGKLVRNVIGVEPNWAKIATLSGSQRQDILALWHVDDTAARPEQPSHPAHAADHPDDPFGEGEDRLAFTYKAYFQSVFGKPYRCSTAQEKVDQAAATALGLPKWRAPDHKYCVWARAYIDALKENAVGNRGREFRIDAIRNNGFVRSPCSYDAFIAWVTSDDPLPNGRYRRNFDSRKPRPEHPAPPRRPI